MAEENGPAIWERQSWETTAEFFIFHLYLEQDPPRSALAAYRKTSGSRGGSREGAKKLPGSWRNLASGYTRKGEKVEGRLSWAQRAAAYDDWLAGEERAKWAQRRLELKEKEWNLASQLMDKAGQILLFPVVAQEQVDGKTVIMPAGWRFKDIPPVAQVASRLARLAADMHTENVSMDWRTEAAQEGLNPDEILRKLTDQFTAQLAGEGGGGGLDGGPPAPQAETGQG